MGDVSTRAKLRLTGTIEIGLPGIQARLTGLEIRREDAHWRERLEGPLSELRKLSAVGPEYASALARVAETREDATAILTLVAPAALARDLAGAEPVDALPQEWLDHEAFAGLLFRLDRWEPESVGIHVEERGSDA